jgi:prepilin-type processing-associated H-X9-DG protein
MSVYAGYDVQKWTGLNAGPNAATTMAGGHWPIIQLNTLRGRYYKQTEWTRPALKGLISDSKNWYNETRNVASEAAIVDPVAVGPVGYDSAASHQFDKWRHSPKRGKKNPVNFNMLYCDGHVATITDIKEGFRAMRMKFPG